MDLHLRITATTADSLGKSIGYKNGKMIGHIRSCLSKGSEYQRRAIAEHFGYPYEEFLQIGQSIIDGTFNTIQATTPKHTMTAQASTTPPQPCPQCGNDIQNKKLEIHQELVGGYNDQEMAIAINEMLIEIERTGGPAALGRATGLVEGLRNEIVKKYGGSQNTGTRGE